jgi:hypothetical protein
VSSLSDFYCARYLYRLSQGGEAVESAPALFVQTLASILASLMGPSATLYWKAAATAPLADPVVANRSAAMFG